MIEEIGNDALPTCVGNSGRDNGCRKKNESKENEPQGKWLEFQAVHDKYAYIVRDYSVRI